MKSVQHNKLLLLDIEAAVELKSPSLFSGFVVIIFSQNTELAPVAK